ncbi:MAG TPA: DUF2851 family protein [Chthoniobacteraceae bacterium]|jgi:hypothetical protein
MDLGVRYGELIGDRFREEPLLRVARTYGEIELQARWFAGEFGREFTTLGGERVSVVQFGIWNRESGPDFAEAAIVLNGAEPVRGCIELDPDARDWERHGHAQNPAYENVVLHVFTQQSGAECFTRTARHRNVPQVLLELDRLGGDPPNPQPTAKPGRCLAPLADLTETKVRDVLFGAAQFRLRRKASALKRLRELHGADEALYQALAGTLGYKSNKLPFTLLAQRLPLKLLRKRDATAMLFGVSGFLPRTDLGAFAPDTRQYLRKLWQKWWPRRGEFERLEIAAEHWSLSGQRPANHPQRRLAALGAIVREWPKIRALAKRCDAKAIGEFFRNLTDEYWDFHYTVNSKTSPRRMALIGESRVTEMLANVFFPIAIGADEARWSEFRELRASLANRRAEIAALRLFGESPLSRELLRRAAMQQGLLQIYEDFCMRDASDCERCRFPQQLARW